MLSNIFSANRRGNRYRHFPTLEECVISYERMTEQMFVVILNDGGAGSAEAVAAHAEWMIARTQRATMDAISDWRRWGYGEPAYLSIPF